MYMDGLLTVIQSTLMVSADLGSGDLDFFATLSATPLEELQAVPRLTPEQAIRLGKKCAQWQCLN